MLAIALPSLLRATPAVSFLHSLTILLRSYILYIKKVLLNQLILSYPVLHSSPSIKHSQNPIPGVLSWLLPTYANIIAMFGQCLPLYLPGFSGQERRWGQALMVAPVMEVKYLSTASSSAMELLALTMEGGQPLQAKKFWERCRINIFRAPSRCPHPMFQHSLFLTRFQTLA